MKNAALYYSVGALLYCPANNPTIAKSVLTEHFGSKYSLALCLEDTINDNFVEDAESILLESIDKIYNGQENNAFFLPKIFIRIRNKEQMMRLVTKLEKRMEIITGFIIPKFSLENADGYINALYDLNNRAGSPIYMMPIYESETIIDLRTRYDILYSLKDKLNAIEDCVLNIRVGGNDLNHVFGFRRHDNESIHQIKPVSQIFSDIITVYGHDYVISGPVWEYFNSSNWEKGLLAEISDDQLCGFTGKTVIHPKQIEVVNAAYAVDHKDYEAARSILNWDLSTPSMVSSDPSKERMDEYKTHTNWAQRILYLSEAFGIKES